MAGGAEPYGLADSLSSYPMPSRLIELELNRFL